eukprot:TRINITY_DN4115_c0_g1_i1.p1 TRINITY_DN4115_c0_g1~~TRINITY_DN4115_c0_g1_i1.p1  ORF type:complete len:255 (+),score=54.43 TRINITY_DN4115_c0_g1_i1:151-915(+)
MRCLRGSKYCVKYSLLIGNLCVLIVGVFLLGFGGYTLKNDSDIKILVVSSAEIPIAIISLGALVVVLSFLGFCSSWLENKCLLYTFLVLLIFLILAEFAVTIAAYVKRDDIPSTLDDVWKSRSADERKSIQDKFTCCGWIDVQEGEPPCPSQDICSDKVIAAFKDNLLILGIVGIVLVAVQVTAITFVGLFLCCVKRRTGEEEEEEEGNLLEEKNPEVDRVRAETAERHAFFRQKYANYGAQNPNYDPHVRIFT